MLLNPVCKYFIEKYFNYVHQENWFVIFFLCVCVLINVSSMTSQNEFGDVPSLFIVWNGLRSIGVISLLVWLNLAVNLSCPGLFFITASIFSFLFFKWYWGFELRVSHLQSRQALYHWATCPVHFALVVLDMGVSWTICPSGLKLRSFWSQPPK
jgi:hypothetical protein